MGSGGSKNNSNTLSSSTAILERRLSHIDTNPPPISDILVKVRCLICLGSSHETYARYYLDAPVFSIC